MSAGRPFGQQWAYSILKETKWAYSKSNGKVTTALPLLAKSTVSASS
jgi:hypothetical protein